MLSVGEVAAVSTLPAPPDHRCHAFPPSPPYRREHATAGRSARKPRAKAVSVPDRSAAFFIRGGPSVFNHVHRLSYDQVSHQEALMHRRFAIVTFLLVFLCMSVACSTNPAGVSATASTTSSRGSKQVTLPAGTVVTVLLGRAGRSKISTDGDP